MDMFNYTAGTVPVILSIPHTGTHVPAAILDRFTHKAKPLPDTDWHVEKLYGFARELGVHIVAATHSRYVIDLNRGADDASLYPGQFTTGLCPTTLFDGSPLYLTGEQPSAEEIRERTKIYWQPYHDKLSTLIETLKQKYEGVTLFDAHSIRSHVPTLFEGTLPDLNLGTAHGTADPALVAKLIDICAASGYSYAHNGRFKGGYITRHYGKPKSGINTVQLELAQSNYMDEETFAYDETKAEKLQLVLRALVQRMVKDAAR